MIRAVTLDAAGTLFTVREPVGATYAAIATRQGIPAEPATVERRFRAAFRAAPPLAFPDAGADERPARERAWWRRILVEALDAAGAPQIDACLDALLGHYADAAAWTVFPDVRPALDGLRAGGWRLGVVSNFDGRLPGLLAQMGLAAGLDAVVWSSEAGVAKPAAAIFRTAARRLGLRPDELCHVGDDPDADVRGAEAAGALALRLDRTGGSPGAIDSLAALPSRLGSRAGGVKLDTPGRTCKSQIR